MSNTPTTRLQRITRSIQQPLTGWKASIRGSVAGDLWILCLGLAGLCLNVILILALVLSLSCANASPSNQSETSKNCSRYKAGVASPENGVFVEALSVDDVNCPTTLKNCFRIVYLENPCSLTYPPSLKVMYFGLSWFDILPPIPSTP